MSAKLTPKMVEVLWELAKPGVKAHYMSYMGRFNPTPYYFLTNSNNRCTAPIRGLLARGLVDRVSKSTASDSHEVVINDKGRAALKMN